MSVQADVPQKPTDPEEASTVKPDEKDIPGTESLKKAEKTSEENSSVQADVPQNSSVADVPKNSSVQADVPQNSSVADVLKNLSVQADVPQNSSVADVPKNSSVVPKTSPEVNSSGTETSSSENSFVADVPQNSSVADVPKTADVQNNCTATETTGTVTESTGTATAKKEFQDTFRPQDTK